MWKSRLIYPVVVIAAFVFSQALYDSISLLTLIVLLLLPFLSIILAIVSYPLITVKTSVSNNILKRFDTFILRIVMRNSSPFVSPSFKITCSVPDGSGQKSEKVVFVLNSACGRRGYFDYKCFFANRGVYSVKVESIEFYDFLRLVKLKKNVKRVINVQSGPRRIELDFPVSSELQNQENTNLVGTCTVIDGGDMIGVRDYAFGDNIKNVHWKLSSKSDNLIMKTFAEDIFDQAYVIADMSAYYDDEILSRSLTDCIVEMALSIIRDYHKKGIRFSLIVNTSKSEAARFSISTPADLTNAELNLSMTSMIKDTTVIDLLRCVDYNLLSGCEVCIITSNVSKEMIKSINKQFVDKNTELRIVSITDNLDESDTSSGIISYSKNYIEGLGRGL